MGIINKTEQKFNTEKKRRKKKTTYNKLADKKRFVYANLLFYVPVLISESKKKEHKTKQIIPIFPQLYTVTRAQRRFVYGICCFTSLH